MVDMNNVKPKAKKLSWFLFVITLIFMFWNIPSNPDIKGIWANIKAKAEVVSEWATDMGERVSKGDFSFGLNFKKVEPPAMPNFNVKTDTNILNDILNNLTGSFKESETTKYNRGDWKHWDNVTSCWTVREEVLYRDSLDKDRVTLLDKQKKPTKNKNNACYITGGDWVDPYTKQRFTNPEDLDIDHMIPLAYAHNAGGNTWDGNKKKDYANYLDYKQHLLAVSASANRSKSDRGPSEWKPDNQEYWCSYGVSWTKIADKWKLALKDSDKKAIVEMLGKCQTEKK